MTKHVRCVIYTLSYFVAISVLGSISAVADAIPGRWALVQSLEVDSQITVKTSTGESFQGRFLKLDPEYLILCDQFGSEPRILRIHVAEITQPKPKKFWTETKIGAIAGLGAGYVIGYAAGDDGIFYDTTAGFSGMVLGGVGAGAGALIGVIVKNARDRPKVIYRSRPQNTTR